MNPKPPPDINIRERLRNLGYLDNTVARFVAGGREGGAASGFWAVIFRAAIVGWLALALLTLGATMILNPFLLRHPMEVLYLALGLGIANLLLAFLFSLIFGGVALLLIRFIGPSRRLARRLVGPAAFSASILVFVYLTFWWVENSAFGEGAEILTLSNLAFVMIAFFIAVLFYRVTSVVVLVIVIRRITEMPESARSGKSLLRWLILAFVAVLSFFGFLYGTSTRQEYHTGEGAAIPRAIISPVHRVLFLGLEGPESRDTLQFLLDHDRLPTLARLAKEGVTLQLTAGNRCDPPPVIWNTISTGVPPEIHGITGYEEAIPAGLSRHIKVSRKHIGLYQILKIVLPALRLTRAVPLSSDHRNSLAVWEIASRAGQDVGIVNWWASWPPDEAHGFQITDRAFMSFAHAESESAQQELPSYRTEGAEDLLQNIYKECNAATSESPKLSPGLVEIIHNASAMDCFHARAGAALYAREFPQFYGLFLQGSDLVEHALKSSKELSLVAQGEILESVYRQMDEAIAGQIAAVSPGTVIVIAVLPGLDALPDHCGEGTCIIALPGAPLAATDNNIDALDLAPTLLALLGIPPSLEMPGRIHPVVQSINSVLLELENKRPVRYPVRIRPRKDGLSSLQDDAYLERLKTLGYLAR